MTELINDNNVTKIKSIIENFFGEKESLKLAYVTAVQKGNPDVVKLFLDSGYINVDDLDLMFKETALMHAARYKHVDLLKFLLQRKANVNRRGVEEGSTALHVVVSGLHDKSTENLEIMKELVKDDSIKLEATNKQGMTPLMVACSQVKTPEVAFLLKNGCDMTIINGMSGLCAPHYCIGSVYFTDTDVVADCFALFLEQRICPDFKDAYERPLIGHAIYKENHKILRQLIYANCDLNIVYTDENRAPAMAHAYKRNQLLSKTMFDAGCDYTKSLEMGKIPVQLLIFDLLTTPPRTLKQLCRTAIRKSIGYYPHTKIHKTNLPQSLQDYVLLKDVLGNVDFK